MQFLRHLQRTGLLLHVVDIAPVDGSSPAQAVRAIAAELEKFSSELAAKPRWLVINKIDLLDASDRASTREALVRELGWDGPVFEVSAATGEGVAALGQAVMRELERRETEGQEADTASGAE
jgi:GTP-binding protein